MVGEIRDPETLNTAIEASLTGHLVLSTLHTNGSAATLTRLLEMGVEPYLLASAMAGVIAQRLVRKTCESCKRPIQIPEPLKPLFEPNLPETIYQGAGCSECGGIGYRGRIGVFELLPMNAELRRLLNARGRHSRRRTRRGSLNAARRSDQARS
jgi:type II secretory ATPase GspE/PulE/Tfp pilus assembly ATPase PilB-like protein